MKLFSTYLFALILAVASSASAAAKLQVFAQVSSSEDIYVGQPFTYHVIIDGESKPGLVDTTPLKKYNPQTAGTRNLSQTSIEILNGKATHIETKRYVMTFTLTANTARVITLPPVSVTIDGQTYQTNPVDVNILKPGTTDLLDLSVTISETHCYVGQPILMTFKFYISTEIGQYRFDIPAFQTGDFHLEDPPLASRQAKQYDLGDGTTAFVSQHRVTHRGKETILLTFSKTLLPRHSGRIKIEPASVSTNVVIGRGRRRGFFSSPNQYKRFMVSSEPLELNVLPLPADNKPADFYGLVGPYTISVFAEPTKVNVGDPITLTIKIGPSDYLKKVRWPQLEAIAQLADNFKIPIQKALPTIEEGFKIFTQTIRANNDKVAHIPPIPLSFFDPESRRYVTAQSDPIKLTVAPTKILTTSDLEGSTFIAFNKEVEAIKEGLSANYEGPDCLSNMNFSVLTALATPAYVPLWALPFIAFVSSALFKLITHTTPEKTAARDRKRAASRAIAQLRKISSADVSKRREMLASAMKEYIGRRFGKVAGSLTADDCRRVISDAANDPQLAEQFSRTIADSEAARYASIDTAVDTAEVRQIIELIGSIEKRLKR